MARTFRRVDRDAVMLLPPDLRDWLPADHLAWLVIETVEELDLSAIEAGFRTGSTGRQAYDPAMLTALLFYAYCTGVRSSRAIEQACLTDVAFRVITAQQRPDHTTIARFRATHEQALGDLFTQVLGLCGRAGLGRVGLVAIDGTKIAANASPRKNYDEDRLLAMAERLLAEAAQTDAAEDAQRLDDGDDDGDELPPTLRPGPDRRARLRQALESLQADRADRAAADLDAARRNVEVATRSVEKARRRARAVHDRATTPRRDRRPIDQHAEVVEATTKLNQALDQLAASTDRAGKSASPTTRPASRRNLTDPDSRLMATTHCGFLQGYNAQIAVSDDHLILAADVTTDRNDTQQFTPMLNQVLDNVATALPEATIGTVLADAGYLSVAALTSPGPDRLIATGRKPAAKTTSRHPAIATMATRLAPDSPDRTRYQRRQATVEPVIGHLKERLGLHRFSRRGLQAVRHELRFAAAAYNLRRLASI